MPESEAYPVLEIELQPADGAWIVSAGQGIPTPALFAESPQSARRFWEFFTAEIPNDNTRKGPRRSPEMIHLRSVRVAHPMRRTLARKP